MKKKTLLSALSALLLTIPAAQAVVVTNDVFSIVNSFPSGFAGPGQSVLTSANMDVQIGFFSNPGDVAANIASGNLGALQADFNSLGDALALQSSTFGGIGVWNTQVLTANVSDTATTPVNGANQVYDNFQNQDIYLFVLDDGGAPTSWGIADTGSDFPASALSINSPTAIASTGSGWSALAGDFEAVNGGSPFGQGAPGPPSDVFVLAQIVPEPSVGLLGLIGGLGMLLRRQRRIA
ncbi:MAG: PEP-CTERM sorting domain-containing protein [Verrucomicrobiota bacterium]